MEAKPKRRWFQFSLRTLLIFMVICAVGAGWLGRRMELKRKERLAVETITKLRGKVQYDYQTVKGTTPPGPKFLRDWLGENFFTEVSTVEIQAHDDGPEWMIPIKEVTFKGSRSYETGLAYLESLPNLRVLTLSGNRITDKELARLSGLANLETLSLADADIGDGGLAKLKGLSKLKSLNVRNTHVTEAAVKELQGSLPDCTITR